MILNLRKIYENVLTLSLLDEENDYMLDTIYIVGSFEFFLEKYSFKVDDPEVLTIYNDDKIPYENYSNNEFYYLPLNLLNEGTKENIETWYEEKVKEKIQSIKEDRSRDISRTENEIKRLQERLERLKKERDEDR